MSGGNHENRSARIHEARLYGIVDLAYVSETAAPAMAALMLAGGVQILQLRAKLIPPAAQLALARDLVKRCRDAAVPFIVNDHPELAAESGADGAHVGQEDISVEAARSVLPAGAIVGKSTHSRAQANAAAGERPDYIGFGPVFQTPTKPDYVPVGTRDLGEVSRTSPVPVFCIGGIKLENLATLMRQGLRRAVVVSGILQADNPRGYCRACREILDSVPLYPTET